MRNNHQTWHFWGAFIGLLAGHEKASENSCILETAPMTRKRPGGWTPVLSRNCIASGREDPHQTCAKLTKNSCCGDKWCRPGRRGTLCFCNQRCMARYASLIPALSAIFSPCVCNPFTWWYETLAMNITVWHFLSDVISHSSMNRSWSLTAIFAC